MLLLRQHSEFESTDIYLKNIQNGDISQGVANTLEPAQKIKKKSFAFKFQSHYCIYKNNDSLAKAQNITSL